MKKIIQQVLDFPQSVNQQIFKGRINDAVDSFDGQNGVRSYVSSIYEYIAFAVFVWMEYNLLMAAFTYLTGTATGIEKAGSLLTIALLILSAFPIAQLIRARGNSFNSSHNGMVSFVFKDFVKTNIRLVGEVVAIMALFSAFNFTLSFLMDQDLFNPATSGANLLSPMAPLATLPMDLLAGIMAHFKFDGITGMINGAMAYRMDNSAGIYYGNFVWDVRDWALVLGSYVNVMVGLIMMYISLAIYGYIYGIISSVIAWIANPSFPISMRNK